MLGNESMALRSEDSTMGLSDFAMSQHMTCTQRIATPPLEHAGGELHAVDPAPVLARTYTRAS
jgi:hypothetical protein